MSIVVQARNLMKYYGDFQAVKGISFEINKGECFGFLGHNGAGKSTTMRMIYGLSTVQQGSLTVLGEQITLTPPRIKARMGVVPQEDSLDPDLTVLENLEVYGGFFGLSSRESRQRGQEWLNFMGLEDRGGVRVDSLSGGNQRRVVIARALINHPEIVVLDEPTTGLDPQGRRLVWQKLRQLKEQGVTLILTTHYMEEAAQLCDRLVVMNDGMILAQGHPEELVQQQVLPYCIEVRLPLDLIPADLAEKVEASGGVVERMADGLFIYTEEGQTVWQKLPEWGLTQRACYLRTSHLEDVFLKLTGRREE